MRNMPRLIADVRRQSIRKQLVCVALICAAVFCAWSELDKYSEKFKEDGNEILSEMKRELGFLSGGAVDKVAFIRKTLGEAASSVNKALKEKRYAYDGDPRNFASTREEERLTEAKAYVATYRTSIERRDRIAEDLKAKISRGDDSDKSKIEARLDRIVTGDASSAPDGVEELGKSMSKFKKVVDAPIVLPWFYQRARDDARDALSRVRGIASGIEWMRDLESVERDANAFSRVMADGIAEMRKCDEMARSAIGNLLSVPFGGRRLVKECLDKLDEAEKTFSDAEALATSRVNAAVESFMEAVLSASNRVEKAAAETQNLLSQHGAFVPEDDIGKIRQQRKAFAAVAASAIESVSKVHSGFIEVLDMRKSRFVGIGEVRDGLHSVSPENEADVEVACMKATSFANEVGGSNLDESLRAVTNGIVVAREQLDAVVEKTERLLSDAESHLPDWEEYSRDAMVRLNLVRTSIGNRAGELEAFENRLRRMSGDGCDDFGNQASRLSGTAKAILDAIPASISCANGKDAKAADDVVMDLSKRAEEFADSVNVFLRDFNEAIVKGKIVEISYDSVRQEWTYYMGLGKDSFDFSLDFPSSGTHKIEILASKNAGQLYTKNKMARSIELKCEVSDSIGSKGEGLLVFGNTVAEPERKLVSFVTDGPTEYRDFSLKLTLSYRNKVLGKQSTSEWDVNKLKLKLLVDGIERDSVLTKERK